MVGQRLSPQIAFGLVLRQARNAAGLSQEKLAFEAGIERNFVSLIETGQNQPTITTLFKIADALKVPAQSLITKTELLLKQTTEKS